MADPTSHVSRRWLYLPFAIAALIFAGYYLLWRAGAQEMMKAVDTWVIDQRTAGLDISHGAVKAEGFPFFLRVQIDEPDIAAPGEWRWRAETLSLDALPYDLNRLIFSPGGEQVLSADGLGEWRGSAEDLRASIANDKTRGWVFAVTVGGAAGHRDADGASYSLASLVFDLAPAPGDPATLTLNLAADGLEFSARDETYAVAQLQAALALSESHMFSAPAPAASWRGAGGELTISRFFADIENTKIAVAGGVHLDRNQYPEGSLKTEIQSPAGLANLLGKAGALSPEEADAAAAGLTLMAMTGGGKITAPIELKDGAAQIAGVKLADLPRVK